MEGVPSNNFANHSLSVGCEAGREADPHSVHHATLLPAALRLPKALLWKHNKMPSLIGRELTKREKRQSNHRVTYIYKISLVFS